MQFLKKNRAYILIGAILIVVLSLIVYYSHLTEHPEKPCLYTYFKEFFELLSFISVTIGSLGILYAYKSYTDLQKGINFTVINGCMNRYTEILPSLIEIEIDGYLDPVKHESTVLSYYDLSNEQLYYIGVGLIPASIEKTWIDGISKKITIQIEKMDGLEKYVKDYDFLRILFEHRKNQIDNKPEGGDVPKPVISKLKKEFKCQIKIDELAHH